MSLIHMYCTVFDRSFAKKGLAMIRSLRRSTKEMCPIYVLALDDIPELKSQPGIIVHQYDEIADDDLRRAKGNRTYQEFCWTCASWYLWYMVSKMGATECTYLDADLFFFSNPQVVFDEIGDRSIGIIPHRFPPRLKENEINGVFNVSWVTIKNDLTGIACINRWRNQCIEWCYYRNEPGKFADQMYLDEWPSLYGDRLCIIQNIGAGCAPWNAEKYFFVSTPSVSVLEKGLKGEWQAKALIFYHFHEYKDPLNLTGYPVSVEQRKFVYFPYIKELGE